MRRDPGSTRGVSEGRLTLDEMTDLRYSVIVRAQSHRQDCSRNPASPVTENTQASDAAQHSLVTVRQAREAVVLSARGSAPHQFWQPLFSPGGERRKPGQTHAQRCHTKQGDEREESGSSRFGEALAAVARDGDQDGASEAGPCLAPEPVVSGSLPARKLGARS